LGNKREPRHTELYSSWKNQKGMSYTTDHVMNETFTLLFRRLSFKEAKRSLDVIDLAIKEGYLCLERITAERNFGSEEAAEVVSQLKEDFKDFGESCLGILLLKAKYWTSWWKLLREKMLWREAKIKLGILKPIGEKKGRKYVLR